MIGLTTRQGDCLRAIEKLSVDGVAPTYDSIAAEMGLASKGRVCHIISGLVERGHFRRDPRRKQCLEVVCPTTPGRTKTDIAADIAHGIIDRFGLNGVESRQAIDAIVMEALR